MQSFIAEVLIFLFVLVLLSSKGYADTKGKLTGKIVDGKEQPVIGANVLIVGTSIGASANEEGLFVILNIPAGVYDVRISAVGYQTKTTTGVRIESGQTATLNVTIVESMIEADAVTVVAERPLVDTRQTSSIAILNRDDMDKLPIQTLNDVVNLQAGVVDGHFRGGRAGEVQYQIDGVSVNNPYDNSSVIQLDKSVLQEVQVITGTFDAEYGQAMSGVVNAVLRSGSDERYEVSAEAYGGNYALDAAGLRTFPNAKFYVPPSIQSYTLSLSGPALLPQTSFLINVRRFTDNGFLYGERRFLPNDMSDFGSKIFRPTGDNEILPMSRNEEWSGQFKISNHSLGDIQISYQAIASLAKSKTFDFSYRLNPDGT
ncbi:MAG: TonB-dependent receptor, partial [bacterium]